MIVTLEQLASSETAMVKLFGGKDAQGERVAPPNCGSQMAYTLSLVYKAVSEHLTYFQKQRAAILAQP